MPIKKLAICIAMASIAWASATAAEDAPPELPFQALDGTSLTPYQEEVPPDSWVRNGNQNPNGQSDGTNGPTDNGNSQDQVLGQQPNPIDSEAPEPALVQAPAPKPKPKKRPKATSKPPVNSKPSHQAQEQVTGASDRSGAPLKPKPGRTESVAIAKGQLNRIVTPYAEPKVLTVDSIETRIEGSVVYIATDSEIPVSLFISDSESGNAISLQLLPIDMGTPAEIIIEQEGARGSGTEPASSRTDTVARQDSPYVDEIKTIMQSMGKQQIPQGFTLEEVTDDIRSQLVCHGSNLSFLPGQLLSGHDSRIVVMVAENHGSGTAVFEEAFCATEDTLAVAAWPKVRLAPGDKTEVYVLMRLPQGKSGEETRPALLY